MHWLGQCGWVRRATITSRRSSSSWILSLSFARSVGRTACQPAAVGSQFLPRVECAAHGSRVRMDTKDPPLESVVDLEELYVWLQQFEDPPKPRPSHQLHQHHRHHHHQPPQPQPLPYYCTASCTFSHFAPILCAVRRHFLGGCPQNFAIITGTYLFRKFGANITASENRQRNF